jgi:hypothetical protein
MTTSFKEISMRKLLTTLALGSALLMALPAQAEEGARRGPGGHSPGQMLQKLDKDGDGQVSKAEFLASAEERFAKMDKNGDGFLSREDRPEGAGEGGGGRLRERLQNKDGGAMVPDVTTE